MRTWWPPQSRFHWRSIIHTAPTPYRFASNMTRWQTECNSSKCTCYLFVCRYYFLLLHKQRFSHSTMSFQPVFQSTSNKATHFQELTKTTSFPFSFKEPEWHGYCFTESCSKETRCQSFLPVLGKYLSEMVRPDHRLSEGGGVAELTCGCSSVWLMPSVRAESSQGRPKEHRPKTSRHSTRVLATAKSRKENSILSNTYTALREHVFFRGNTFETINASRGQWLQMPATILEEVLLRHLTPLKYLHTPGTESPTI